MMAMGITRGGPEASHCTSASARGPLLRADFRCPAAVVTSATHNSAAKLSHGARRTRAGCNMFCCRRGFIMQANDKAPDFTLSDQDGRQVSWQDFRGKTVILYFFPKANTPG
jgi:hypothetical protein